MANSTSNFPIFSGEFRHAVDEKNRVTIPSRWRAEGGVEEFFVVKNPKRPCLTVMPPAVFQQVGENAARNATPAEHRVFMTHFYSQAKSCSIDKQGRLLLPDEQCKTAALKGEVVLTGSSDRFEVWNAANWSEFQEAGKSTYEKVADLVGL
jgi:MraZ protein